MAAADLVTMNDAWQWLGIAQGGADDRALQAAISGVSQAIASWCTRNFVIDTYSEVYDGTGQRSLTVKNFPLISIQSLVVNDRPIAASATMLGNGYRFNRRTVTLNGEWFQRGTQNVAITYTSGTDPIPQDIKIACLTWVQTWFLGRDRDPDLVSRKAGDTEEKFGRISAVVGGHAVPMPQPVYAVLSQYRDVIPA